MARLLSSWPYILAIATVLAMASDVWPQDKAEKQRNWSVTYINEHGQIMRSEVKQTRAGCIATIRLIYNNPPFNYYCTADAK